MIDARAHATPDHLLAALHRLERDIAFWHRMAQIMIYRAERIALERERERLDDALWDMEPASEGVH